MIIAHGVCETPVLCIQTDEESLFWLRFEAQSQGAQSAVGLTSHPSTGAAVEASGSSATELPSQDGRQAVKLGFGAGKKQKVGTCNGQGKRLLGRHACADVEWKFLD